MTGMQDILKQLNASYPFAFEQVGLLREGGCTSYLVTGEKKRYFLKTVSAAFMDTAVQSLDILLFLDARDYPVPAVVRTKQGLPYFSLAGDGKDLCILFEYIDGTEPKVNDDTESIGELTGRLHALMENYPGKLIVREKDFFIGRYLRQMQTKNYPEEKLSMFREYGDALWERVKDLPTGYCHGDLHRGNLLRTPAGGHVLLDFDTSCRAFPIYDAMTFCDATDYFHFKASGYQSSKHIFDRFLRGYCRFRTPARSEVSAFFDLIAIRHYQLQATIFEIYGLGRMKKQFLDKQLDWLMRWKDQCDRERM